MALSTIATEIRRPGIYKSLIGKKSLCVRRVTRVSKSLGFEDSLVIVILL
jgi:hypothetical protein